MTHRLLRRSALSEPGNPAILARINGLILCRVSVKLASEVLRGAIAIDTTKLYGSGVRRDTAKGKMSADKSVQSHYLGLSDCSIPFWSSNVAARGLL